GADTSASQLADPRWRPEGPGNERSRAPAWPQFERDQRKGDPPARLGTASEGRGYRRNRRKPDPAWPAFMTLGRQRRRLRVAASAATQWSLQPVPLIATGLTLLMTARSPGR